MTLGDISRHYGFAIFIIKTNMPPYRSVPQFCARRLYRCTGISHCLGPLSGDSETLFEWHFAAGPVMVHFCTATAFVFTCGRSFVSP